MGNYKSAVKRINKSVFHRCQQRKPQRNQQLYRTGAPDTSVAAAYEVNTSRLEKMVHDVIRSFGVKGCISDDVREVMSDFAYSSVTARYRSLEEKELIRYTGEKRKGLSGRGQRVMVVDSHPIQRDLIER